MFSTEKGILEVIPYWLIVAALVGLTALSFLPRGVSVRVLRSKPLEAVARIVMHRPKRGV